MIMKKTRTKTSTRTNFVTQNHKCCHMGMGIIYYLNIKNKEYIYIIYIYVQYIYGQVNKHSSKQKRKTSVWVLTLLASLTQNTKDQKKNNTPRPTSTRFKFLVVGAVRPKTSGSPVASSHTRRSNCQTYFDLCGVCCFPSFGEWTKGLLLYVSS